MEGRRSNRFLCVGWDHEIMLSSHFSYIPYISSNYSAYCLRMISVKDPLSDYFSHLTSDFVNKVKTLIIYNGSCNQN